MSDVYRARDTKLLASLNHPNIASIYGFESGGLVLELVEGPTLAKGIEQGTSINALGRLPQGGRSGDSAPARRLRALPVDEAIAIAKQIADALEAGHEAGIIHRGLEAGDCPSQCVRAKSDSPASRIFPRSCTICGFALPCPLRSSRFIQGGRDGEGMVGASAAQ